MITPTAQELFDRAALGILNQGRKSTDTYGNCAYRGEGRLKCAVGHIIPDEMYCEEFDSPNVADTSVCAIAPKLHEVGLNIGDNLGLLREMQNCHDAFFVIDWPTELKRIAISRGLNPKAVENWEKSR